MIYNEFINMNIEDFNALENKTIGHVILYFYHNQNSFENYVFSLKDIYRMGLDLNSFYQTIESAYEAIIKHLQLIGRSEYAESFEMYLDNFRIAQLEHRGPLKYWGESPTQAFEAFYDVIEFVWEILSDFDCYTFGDLAHQTIFEHIDK